MEGVSNALIFLHSQPLQVSSIYTVQSLSVILKTLNLRQQERLKETDVHPDVQLHPYHTISPNLIELVFDLCINGKEHSGP